ncbi:hypothetical protein TESG_08581 [Trichophyton tonsurans CBS 112818]|uniref:Uncharacterized protein n=1 Tax=Trichophyton tonsurans (strain CBS 112818) TaxID=647933 RepID=F2S6B1_TRIT1|nr:hypothetical protein TESG_08581 [Trichophyton tonsurans CBS 112818]
MKKGDDSRQNLFLQHDLSRTLAIMRRWHTETTSSAFSLTFHIEGRKATCRQYGRTFAGPRWLPFVPWRQVSVISEFSPLGGATLDGSMPNSNSFYLTNFTLHWRDWRRIREDAVRSFAHRTANGRGQALGSAGDLPSHIMQPKNTMAKKCPIQGGRIGLRKPGQEELASPDRMFPSFLQ